MIKNKRYFLFGWDVDYPKGGMNDLLFAFETTEDFENEWKKAEEKEKHIYMDFYEIYDYEEKEVIAETQGFETLKGCVERSCLYSNSQYKEMQALRKDISEEKKLEQNNYCVFKWIEKTRVNHGIFRTFIGKVEEVDRYNVIFKEIYEVFGSGVDFDIATKKKFNTSEINIHAIGEELKKEFEKAKNIAKRK